MPRRHAASLLPKWHHDPALLALVRSPLTNTMVSHIAEKAVQVIRCKPDPVSTLPSPPTTPTSTGFDSALPSLESFIKIVVRKSKCHVPTLLCTLVYLDRLKYRLPPRSSGSPTTRHRVFLSALIVAAKYLNDSSPQNKHWQKYAVHFSLQEIEVMERQLLALLDFDLRIDESELLEHFAPFLEPVADSTSIYTTPRSASNPIISPTLQSLESRPKTSRGPSSSPSASSADGTHTGSTGRLLTPSYSLETPALTPSTQVPVAPTTSRGSNSSRPPPRPARSPERGVPRPLSWDSTARNRMSSGSSYSSYSSSTGSSSGPQTPMDEEPSPIYSPQLRLRKSDDSLGGALKREVLADTKQQEQVSRGRKNEKDLRISVPGAYYSYREGADGLPSPPSEEEIELDSDDGRGGSRRRRGVELNETDRIALGVRSGMAVF